MIWERANWYKGRKCILCKKSTSDMAAPMGIASGSFPFCRRHSDQELKEAYFELLQEHLEAGGQWKVDANG